MGCMNFYLFGVGQKLTGQWTLNRQMILELSNVCDENKIRSLSQHTKAINAQLSPIVWILWGFTFGVSCRSKVPNGPLWLKLRFGALRTILKQLRFKTIRYFIMDCFMVLGAGELVHYLFSFIISSILVISFDPNFY